MNDNYIQEILSHQQLDQKNGNTSPKYGIVNNYKDLNEFHSSYLEDEKYSNIQSHINTENEIYYPKQYNNDESILQNRSLLTFLDLEKFKDPSTHKLEEKFIEQQQFINPQKNYNIHNHQNTQESNQIDKIQNNSLNNNTNKYQMKDKIIAQSPEKLKINNRKYQFNNQNKQNNLQEVQNAKQNNKNEKIVLQIDSDDDDENISLNTLDEIDQSQSVEIIDQNNTSKVGVNKFKKLKKNKKEKIKSKEILQVSTTSLEIVKKDINQQENKQNLFLNLTRNIVQNIQFYVFCDITIEQKLVRGGEGNIEQTKRADINQIKYVSKIIEHQNNVVELVLSKSQDSLMEFENYSKFLLSLQDEYAKQVFDSLQSLQEKSRLAYQTISMIQNNRSMYEYILKRKKYAQDAFESFKANTLPKHKYYIYNRYLFDLRNGNFSLSDVGYSRDTLNLLAINTDIFKQTVSKFGIVEFIKQSQKLAFKVNYFSQFIFSMQNLPKHIRYVLDFITLDNIQIKLNVEQYLVDLCEEYDKFNNFDCPFIDFVFLAIPQITSEAEDNLSKIRKEQNIDINSLLEMDSEEINFYYNHESQQLLKRYYNDIYNRNINIPNLTHQKVDFTHIQM